MAVQRFALIYGIAFLAAGILGFIPAFLTPPSPLSAGSVHVNMLHGYLLGLFPVNVLHSLVHVAIGLWGLAASRGFTESVSYSRGVTVIYAILAVMGLFPVLNTVFGLIPIHGHDIWLHAGSAAVAAYFGWGAPARVRRTVRI